MYSKMLIVRLSIGRSLRCAVWGMTSTAKGVMAMLTTEGMKVMTAANAKRGFAMRVNCRAMSVPGIAASSRMPTGVSCQREDFN
jgi:hypothetical protein